MAENAKPKAEAESKTERMFEVEVSFNGMNKGERFTQSGAADLAWANRWVEAGYLRDVTDHPTAREAHHASEERQG